MVASNSSYTEISACIVVRVPRGRDQMVVGFIATCSTKFMSSNPVHGEVSMTCGISVVFAGYSGFIHQ